MIHGQTFVFLFGESWRSPLRTSKHHLAAWLGQRNTVLYVEDPLHPLSVVRHPDRRTSFVQSLGRPIEHVGGGVHVLRSMSVFPFHRGPWPLESPLLNDANMAVVAPQVRRALDTLGVRRPNLVLYLGHAAPLLTRLEHRSVIFHLVDDFCALPGYPASYPVLEQTSLRAADLVIATSQRLADLRRPFCRRVEVVRHGAHVGAYLQAADEERPPPRELLALSRPIVGYHGALHKLDHSLIAQIARLRPDWSFVLIGPKNGIQGARLSGLSSPNIHLLGPKPFSDVPRYVTRFDAAFMPFVRNALTEAMCPIKMYEYLAAGLPMVGSAIPELRLFAPWAGTATTPTEFVEALERAMANNGADARARRRAAAPSHDWRCRLQQIEELVEGVISSRSSAP